MKTTGTSRKPTAKAFTMVAYRLTADDVALIDYCREKLGASKTEIFRRALRAFARKVREWEMKL